jgi:hypothetical protein
LECEYSNSDKKLTQTGIFPGIYPVSINITLQLFHCLIGASSASQD